MSAHGYPETVYFDISYSAVPDGNGGVGGVLCIVQETTEHVVAERNRLELALEDSAQRSESVFEGASVGMIEIDSEVADPEFQSGLSRNHGLFGR